MGGTIRAAQVLLLFIYLSNQSSCSPVMELPTGARDLRLESKHGGPLRGHLSCVLSFEGADEKEHTSKFVNGYYVMFATNPSRKSIIGEFFSESNQWTVTKLYSFVPRCRPGIGLHQKRQTFREHVCKCHLSRFPRRRENTIPPARCPCAPRGNSFAGLHGHLQLRSNAMPVQHWYL